MLMLTRHAALLPGLAIALGVGAGAFAQDRPPMVIDETAKDIVATTVRSQGYSCEHPKRAVRDEAASSPDQAAWVVECANASYWVKYDNDLPAEIRQLD
jgi:hypothetical protein